MRLWQGSLKGIRPVHQVQVQILQLEVSQSLPEGRLHILGVVLGVPQFGCHEQLLPRHRLAWSHVLLQGLPNLRLIAVDSSTINVAVAYTKGILNSCFYLPGERSRGFSSMGFSLLLSPPQGQCSGRGGQKYSRHIYAVEVKRWKMNWARWLMPVL